MNIRIESHGVKVLLDLLEDIKNGKTFSDDEITDCFSQNDFFINYYCSWASITREKLLLCIRSVNKTALFSENAVLQRLHNGFMYAANHADELRNKMQILDTIDFNKITKNVVSYLPLHTDLECTIHYTLDSFNGAFQYKNGIGFSLIMFKDLSKEYIIQTLSHELHHLGFKYWAEKDAIRKVLLNENSGRSIAVSYVQDLCMEGLACYYFTPVNQLSDDIKNHLPEEYLNSYNTRLKELQNNELQFFNDSEELLKQALDDSPDLKSCKDLLWQNTIDENGIEPAGHYIGYRMAQEICNVYEKSNLINCITDLSLFLLLYNRAVSKTPQKAFNQKIIERFSALWQETA
ncbi:MAG: hypothetical protein BKP49_00075 [Treponema sp. CETP13]|nr:MAG: hypothetical protein BKP49_00075 [Treponema sp. CETP13]